MVTLSIIVPVYNVEQYLSVCIDSILNQTFQDFELILVNDGSTDNSAQICEKYSSEDNRIIVIHKSNEGLVNARKSGLAIATGRFIGNIDSDDWIEPDMYSSLVNSALQNDADLVIGGLISHFSSGVVYHKSWIKPGVYDLNNNEKIYNNILYSGRFFEFGITPNLVNKIFVRDKYLQFQNDVDSKITMGEDLAVTFPYIIHSKKIVIIDKYVYNYRRYEFSMTNKYKKQMSNDIEILYKYLFKNDVLTLKLGNQLTYYYAYLLILLVKNEFSKPSENGYFKIQDQLQKLKGKEFTKNIVSSIDFKHLPLKNRVLIKSLNRKTAFFLVYIYYKVKKIFKEQYNES